MLIERTIKIPIYDYKVKVVIFDDKEEVKNILEEIITF